jgi:radical SAM-linked protein
MTRLLIKYAKTGEVRFLSHRETIRSLERGIRRSGLPIAFTAGYSPRMRMTFSPALPLGIEAEAEYLEVAVDGRADLERARSALNQALPRGLSVTTIQELSATMPKLSKWTRYGLYRVGMDEGEVYLLLSLTGPRQGRLKDALAALAESLEYGETGFTTVCRTGLFACEEEVFEDLGTSAKYFDGELGELVTIENER